MRRMEIRMELTEASVTEDITPFERERLREALEEEVRGQLPTDRRLLRVVDWDLRTPTSTVDRGWPPLSGVLSPGRCSTVEARLFNLCSRGLTPSERAAVVTFWPHLATSYR